MQERTTGYMIPPDMRRGRYYFGFTGGELGLIAGLAAAVLLLLGAFKSIGLLPLGCIPAVLGVLFYRTDFGFGYQNLARRLWVILRYFVGESCGAQMFSLRRAAGKKMNA